ncbi:MAG: hydroxypyruvate isomerase family protein [Devosia sp.]|nr:hydroxypyruvate isomerase family protein [Devosia sp.]
MLRFSANLSMLYPELPFLDRFAAAARDGFAGVEYLGPYSETPRDIADRLAAHGLTQVLFNLPSGDWARGERGLGALAGRVEEFQRGVGEAIRYAKLLGCQQVNCLAGIPKGVGLTAAEDTLVANLTYAAPRLADAGIKLLLEPINPYDIPGFFVTSSAQALRIFDRVQSDNLFLQYDFYHMQRVQGELVANFKSLMPRIAHVQIADNPGRNEPGTGEINYGFIFAELERLGYSGWVGAEYKPKTGTSDGLGWLRSYRGATA